MFKELLNAFNEMSVSDKWLFGVAALVIINTDIAFCIALGLVFAFICRVFWPVIKNALEKAS